MRTWMINLTVSVFALIAIPVVFFVLSGGFSQQQSQFGTTAPQPFSNPFAGVPRGYQPQFGFQPQYQRPVITTDMQRQRCLSDVAAHSEIDSDYGKPFCDCAAARSYYTSGAQGNRIALACRGVALVELAQRSDALALFDTKFAQRCNAQYLDPTGRIDGAKVSEMCGCVASSIKQQPLRAAAIAFTGAENDGNRALSGDIQGCTMQTKAFAGDGFKIEEHFGDNVAVLQTRGHYDIQSLTLSCTADKQMRLDATYRTNGRHTDELKRDASSYTNGWQIHLKDGAAVGKEVSDFYQFVIDEQEKNGTGPGGTTEFTELMPDGHGDEYEALFGDVKKVVAPVLQACTPKPAGDFAPPPVSAEATALPNVSPDKWAYAGRAATFGLDLPPDGVGPLTMLNFNCEGEPFLELAGGFTDDEKARDRLTISFGAGKPLVVKMICDYGEGGIACSAPFKGDQLSRMAAAPAIALSVGGKVLATVPFGSSEGIKKAFPYCKLKQSPPKPGPSAAQAAGASRPRITVGGSYKLANAMNLRASAAADGRILRSLPVGTTLGVVRQVKNARGEAWSAVSLLGTEVGYVNDAALSYNVAPSAGAPLGSAQKTKDPTHGTRRSSASTPP